MFKIGLTGGIGSGKTTVAKIFGSIGIPVFYSDTEAKKKYFVPNIRNQVEALMGKDVYKSNSELDLNLLRKIFIDKNVLSQLNQIIHPATRAAYQNWHQAQNSPYTINEAAILFETDAFKQFDKIILVVSPQKIRLKRIMKRDLISEDEVLRRMSLQWSDAKKSELSDFIIVNDGEKSLIKQVLSIHASLTQ